MGLGMATRVEPGTVIGPLFNHLMTGAEIPLFAAATGAMSVFVQAHPDNTGVVWVGPAGVNAGVGAALAASASIVINVNNAALIHVWGITVTDRAVGFVVR